MRKYVSVWMLFVKSCLGRVLAVLVLEGIAVGICYGVALHDAFLNLHSEDTWNQYYATSLQEVLRQAHLGIIAGVAFFLLSVMLMDVCGEHGSRTSYRLRSLRIPETAVYVMQILTNLVFYLLFWAVQVVIVYICAKFYTLQDGFFVTEQTIMLAFYQDSFLHAILPLAETILYARNLVLGILLSVGTACYAPLVRRTSFVWEIIAFLVVTLAMFPVTGGNGHELGQSVILIIVGILADMIMLIRLRGKEVEQ